MDERRDCAVALGEGRYHTLSEAAQCLDICDGDKDSKENTALLVFSRWGLHRFPMPKVDFLALEFL